MERDPCLWQFRGHLQLQEGAGTLLPPNHSPSLGLPISALPASVPPRCQSTHPTALKSTKNSHPRSSTCHFYTPSSSCLPSAAVPAFLPAPCFPSSHLLLGFYPLHLHLLTPLTVCLTCLHLLSLPSPGMTTTFPFPSRGRGATIPHPTAAKGLHPQLSSPCTPGLCLEAGTLHAEGCFSLHHSSGQAHTLTWLLYLRGAVG